MAWNMLCLILLAYLAALVSAEKLAKTSSAVKANDCYSELARIGKVSNLITEVALPEEFKHFCSLVDELKKCITDNVHFLRVEDIKKYQIKTSGVKTFYKDACSPGKDIMDDYKLMAPCFKLFKREITSCESNLPELTSDKMRKNHNYRCCAVKSHNDCVISIGKKCNTASTALGKMLEQYFKKELEGCEEFEHDKCSLDDYDITTIYPSSITVKKYSKEYYSSASTFNYPSKTEDWHEEPVTEGYKKHKGKSHASLISPNFINTILTSIAVLLLKYSL